MEGMGRVEEGGRGFGGGDTNGCVEGGVPLEEDGFNGALLGRGGQLGLLGVVDDGDR